jgi:hypothetical protein
MAACPVVGNLTVPEGRSRRSRSGMTTVIELDQPATQAQITVFSRAQAGRVEAFNEDQSSAGTFYLQASQDPQTFSFNGSSVRVLGVLADKNESLLLQKVCFDGMETDFQAGITVLDALGGQNITIAGGFTEYHPMRETASRPAARIHDNEVVCPRGQALIAAGLGAMSISDNLLMSNGFRNQPDLSSLLGTSADSLKFLLAACGSVLILDLGRTLEGATSFGMVNMGSHFEANVLAKTSTQREVFPEGRIQFHDNQVTLKDEGVSTQPILRIAILMGSLDDISLEGNQIRIETADEILPIGTLAVGFDVRATDNRFTEIPQQSLVSYFGLGGSAITANNLATQCIVTFAAKKIDSPNLSLYCP